MMRVIVLGDKAHETSASLNCTYIVGLYAGIFGGTDLVKIIQNSRKLHKYFSDHSARKSAL